MNLSKVTLPLLAMLALAQQCAVNATPASALDPYSYIPAPTKEERELALAKKQKKAKVPKTSKTVAVTTPTEAKTQTSKPQTASNSNNDEGFLDGVKESASGIIKSTKAVGSKIAGSGSLVTKGAKSIGQGFASAGEKVKGGSTSVATGFKSAGSKIVDGTVALPKAIGQGVAKTASKVGGSGDTAKKLAAAPAAGIGAIGHGLGKLNPFHKNESEASPTAIASKDKPSSAQIKSAQPPVDADSRTIGQNTSEDLNQTENLTPPEATAATPSAIPQ